MPEKESEKIEIRSDEVQDILGMIPSWIVRWGTVVILLTVLAILAGSWFFRYPDIITADIIVTTENPPSTLEARTDGQIEFFVEDNQYVEINKPLAMIKNQATRADVTNLKFEIELLRTLIPDFKKEEFRELDEEYQLGEIQPAYSEFIRVYEDYYNFLVMDTYEHLIRTRQDEIRGHQSLLREMENENQILQERLNVAKRQLNSTSESYKEGSSTQFELDDAQEKKLELDADISASQQAIISTKNEIRSLVSDTSQLRLNARQEKQDKQGNLRVAFENLNAQIDNWEQKYLLIAPIDGLVTLPGAWAENQNVNTGDEVLTVVPKDPGDTIGRIDLPMEGSGKVETGMDVNIKLDNFSHLQYGMVPGKIRSKGLVAYDDLYSVEVGLPDGLITYYGDTIPFNQEMPGRAEIITDDRRLLERITSPIRSALTEQRGARKPQEQD